MRYEKCRVVVIPRLVGLFAQLCVNKHILGHTQCFPDAVSRLGRWLTKPSRLTPDPASVRAPCFLT